MVLSRYREHWRIRHRLPGVPSTRELQLWGVLCTGESRLPPVLYTRELKNLLCWKSKVVLYTGESNSLMSYSPGSHFSVSLNLQAHATAFQATLIQKLSDSKINCKKTCLKHFPSPRTKPRRTLHILIIFFVFFSASASPQRPTCCYHANPAGSPTRNDMTLQVGELPDSNPRDCSFYSLVYYHWATTS